MRSVPTKTPLTRATIVQNKNQRMFFDYQFDQERRAGRIDRTPQGRVPNKGAELFANHETHSLKLLRAKEPRDDVKLASNFAVASVTPSNFFAVSDDYIVIDNAQVDEDLDTVDEQGILSPSKKLSQTQNKDPGHSVKSQLVPATLVKR